MSFDLSPDAEGLSKAVATMTLESGGVIKFRFFPNDAPNTVKRITQLISEGYYNGIKFHRVIPGFMAQGGDPTGTGTSGSGVKLKAEFNKRKHVPGILSMARAQDPNSADSQFFIMTGTHPHLDGSYTAFGMVVSGQEHVEKIKKDDKIATWTIE
jgi:cyclophilin family peptidyl-prolyl cis-trans isomerase